ncbi:Aste57867_3474 [Aphanomyces stellatus]|uniref:Aste57867_3474 protein n=2 Tax=Aphanomyces stellatus TaxID=120398 RepID=A0A485KBH1_9STRA|nr:hypothetical protein As57867_003464 [Aphanomyces stellatus]VFT80640.1 Aste57867_3474 [Aphanomyces stellatus]
MSFSVANRKKGRCGRKFKFTPEQVKAKLIELPLADRTTWRSISEKTEVKLATLHRYLKHGMFRAHSSTVWPVLTDANKYARLIFAASMVGSDMVLKEMEDVVHLDEKWFYITKVKRTFYLVPGEKVPKRKCKSKRFITKVMFLSAVARPRYDEVTGLWWNGKIGTWPFTEKVAAARSSVNRPAGTIETKTITVTKDIYRSFLVNKVLPAIESTWQGPTRVIKLQYDNAKAHVTSTDAGLCAAFLSCAGRGWSFSLDPQPPNSPDMNILDLGFFNLKWTWHGEQTVFKLHKDTMCFVTESSVISLAAIVSELTKCM